MKSKAWLWILILIGIGAAVYFIYHSIDGNDNDIIKKEEVKIAGNEKERDKIDKEVNDLEKKGTKVTTDINDYEQSILRLRNENEKLKSALNEKVKFIESLNLPGVDKELKVELEKNDISIEIDRDRDLMKISGKDRKKLLTLTIEYTAGCILNKTNEKLIFNLEEEIGAFELLVGIKDDIIKKKEEKIETYIEDGISYGKIIGSQKKNIKTLKFQRVAYPAAVLVACILVKILIVK